MPTIRLKRVPCLTIYNRPTELEAMARRYPEAAHKFVAQNPKMIESWTMLDERIAPSFLALQNEWVRGGGDLYVTDMHRPVLGEWGQIATYRRRPKLAVRPGWSTHIGFAFDFVMERLGGRLLTEFHAVARDLGWAVKEAWHLQKLPGWRNPGDTQGFMENLAKPELPLTIEGIRRRLIALGYAGEDNLRDAVIAFQGDFGLSPDGIPGPKTQMSLVLGTIQTEVVP